MIANLAKSFPGTFKARHMSASERASIELHKDLPTDEKMDQIHENVWVNHRILRVSYQAQRINRETKQQVERIAAYVGVSLRFVYIYINFYVSNI